MPRKTEKEIAKELGLSVREYREKRQDRYVSEAEDIVVKSPDDRD